MTKISIIISVYNANDTITKTLDSIVNQSLKDIEVICINDGSTDGTEKILNEYASKDDRIVVIENHMNRGLAYSRKMGMQNASGEYTMFVDADDWIENNTCQELYCEISDKNLDIMAFGVNVNCQEAHNTKWKTRYEKYLSWNGKEYFNNNVINICVENHTLWNKIYRTNLCKKVAKKINDTWVVIGEDYYISFMMSSYANTFSGVNNKYYHYSYGNGVSTSKSLTISEFEKFCKSKKVVYLISEFVENENSFNIYQKYIDKAYNELLTYCIKKWCENIRTIGKVQGFKMMVKYWGIKETLLGIHKIKEKKISKNSLLKLLKKKIKIQKKKVVIARFLHGIIKIGDK